MQKIQRGFTLIELVIVIIIVGILAVVAIPQYIDLSNDAKTAAVTSVAASLTSANAINYISRKANPTKGIAVTNCINLGSALQGGLPNGYVITNAAVAVDTVVTCTLTGPDGTTQANFSATGIT